MPKIQDLPKADRPREKLLKGGVEALSSSELLSILLGSGLKGKNVKEISSQIIKKAGDNFLEITLDDLLKIQGIGKAKALQIVASIALVGRYSQKNAPYEKAILLPEDAVNLCNDIADKKKEYLICLFLNARNILLKKEVIAIGTLDRNLIHPREIFSPAIELHSAGVIVVHNHPSGDPTPSKLDISMFKKIMDAGKLLGINVVDFIILGGGKSYSYLQSFVKKDKDTQYLLADGTQTSLLDFLIDV